MNEYKNHIFLIESKTESVVEVTFKQALIGLEWYNRDIDITDSLALGAEYFTRCFPELCMDTEDTHSEVTGIIGPVNLVE